MDELIELGILPESYKSYRQTTFGVFDIETLQTSVEADECNSLVYEAIQIPVSIGFSSNVSGYEEKYFVRSSSDPEAGFEMVKQFLDYLEQVQSKFVDSIPTEITEACQKIQTKLKCKFSGEKTKLSRLNNFLNRLTQEIICNCS